MKLLPIWLILFWAVVIFFPEFLAYLIGWFFVFMWINALIISKLMKKKDNMKGDDYVQFGKYKIYK